MDKIVCLASLSIYSHCELVMSDGLCLSASKRDDGIRAKYINLNEKWHVYDLKGTYNEQSILYWFFIHDGEDYDWRGAVGSVFGIDTSNPDKKYCSAFCALMLGITPTKTPGNLFRYLKKANLINV